MTNEEREHRGGLGKAIRSIVIWLVVVIVAAGVGFGAGYFLRDKEARGLEQFSAEEKAEMQAQITSLEKQVLEAEKSQLERALARAKLKAGLDEVLDSLTGALTEVEQRNFGRATQKIEAAKGALSAAPNTPETVQTAIMARLDKILAGLKNLDIKAREEIASLAKELEEGPLPGSKSK
ncbi:MAG: hypothetical protein ACE5MG_01500 [Candidatus Methylomirabilales bacterium]